MFGGVGFGVEKIKNAFAYDPTPGATTLGNACGFGSEAGYQDCKQKYEKANRDRLLAEQEETNKRAAEQAEAAQLSERINQVCGNDTTTAAYIKCKAETEKAFKYKDSFWSMITGDLEIFAKGAGKIVLDVIGFTFQLLIIPTLGVLVRICGYILDTSVVFTLSSENLGMNGSGLGTAIVTVWILIRNIFNITFIFILLWSAIQMIIGIAGANAKKMIANVIIAALLINFSLFITRIVIDIGNILGTELYNLIKVGYSDAGIGTIMMDKMGLSALWNFDEATSGNMFTISVLQIIMLLTTIVAFMYAALLMIARTVSLIFIMVMSPLGFMGDVMPSVSEYAKMWRTNLFGQVSTAPLFLLFIYLIVQVSGSLNSSIATLTEKTATAAKDVDNPMAYISYLKYVMIIMLLIIAVKIVKKQSGVIGSAVEKFGTAAAGIALGAATGGAALLATKTLGAGASAIRDSKFGEKLKDSNSFAARMTLKGLDKTSKSTFDARNTSTFKTATGFVGDQTGIKVDYNRGIKTQKDGFEGSLERNTKRAEDYAKMVTKDMPEVNVGELRKGINSDLQAKNSALEILRNQAIPTEEKAFKERQEQISKLEKEAEELKTKSLKDDKQLKKDTEQEIKSARLNKIANEEAKGKVNWLVGGAGARRAAAAKVRKLAAEKTAAELRKEAEKRQREENKAAGIVDEDEKPKEEKIKEEKPKTEEPKAK